MEWGLKVKIVCTQVRDQSSMETNKGSSVKLENKNES